MSPRRLACCALLVALAASPARVRGQAQPGIESDPRLQRPLSLSDCVALALENNLELRIARLDESATRTGITEAYGAFWPVLGLTGERTYWRWYGEFPDKNERLVNAHAHVTQLLPIGTNLLASYDAFHARFEPDRTDTPARRWTFGITQPLLRGFGWRNGTAPVRGARYDTSISEQNLEKTRLDVVQRVESAYYEVLRALKLVEVNSKGVERDQQLVLQSQSKLEAGLGTRRDMLSAEIQREQDRGVLVDSQTSEREARDQLARLMGLRVDVNQIAIADSEVTLDSVVVQEDTWVDKALRDNPTVRAARLTVERTRLDMQVAGNGRLPQLDLQTTWKHFDDPDLNELRKEENLELLRQGKEPKELGFTAYKGWQTFLTFSYPIGNRTLGAAYKRARLVHQQAQRTLEDTERQVTLDVRSGIRVLDNNVEQLGILRKNIEGARNKLEFASVNFQLGRASNLDVVDAQKDLIDAETEYVNSIIDYRIQLSRIKALVGGL